MLCIVWVCPFEVFTVINCSKQKLPKLTPIGQLRELHYYSIYQDPFCTFSKIGVKLASNRPVCCSEVPKIRGFSVYRLHRREISGQINANLHNPSKPLYYSVFGTCLFHAILHNSLYKNRNWGQIGAGFGASYISVILPSRSVNDFFLASFVASI